jgi:hypothetical protein
MGKVLRESVRERRFCSPVVFARRGGREAVGKRED